MTAIVTVAGTLAHDEKDGPIEATRFYNIQGIVCSKGGVVYVSDCDRIRAIYAGHVITLAGSRRGFCDGVAPTHVFTTLVVWPWTMMVTLLWLTPVIPDS